MTVAHCLESLKLKKRQEVRPEHPTVGSVASGAQMLGGEYMPRYFLKPPFVSYSWDLDTPIEVAVPGATKTILDGGELVYPTVISAEGRRKGQEVRAEKIRKWKKDNSTSTEGEIQRGAKQRAVVNS